MSWALLRSAEENSDENDENTSKATSIKSKGNEWMIEDDMPAVYALESFNLALADLKRYFYYDEDLVYVLQSNEEDQENDVEL